MLQPNQNKIRVAAYGRYSCDQQSELSADDQLKRIRRYVGNGLIPGRNPAHSVLVDEWQIKDEALSGKTVSRAGYEAILRGIRSKSFDLLVVDDLSRLTRDLGSLLSLYQLLRFYEVELYSICDRLSSNDPGAKIAFTVRGMVNDFTNEVHAERVLRGLESRVTQGFSSGHCPYGYDSKATQIQSEKKPFPSHFKIFVKENEAEVIRRIFAMYATGEIGCVRIAKILNSENIPSPDKRTKGLGSGWSSRTVSNFLTNEKYIGVWRWKKTRLTRNPETGKRMARPRPANEWFSPDKENSLAHLRIIEQSVWDSVQKIRKEKEEAEKIDGREKRWGKNAGRLPEHPFSGLLQCGECSSNYSLVSGKNGGYYGCFQAHQKGLCKNKQLLNIKRVEEAIFSMLSSALSRPEIVKFALKSYMEAFSAKMKGSPERIKQLKLEIKNVEKEKANLIQFIAQGNNSQSLSDAIRDREIKEASLSHELLILNKAQPRIKSLTAEDVQTRIERLHETIVKIPLESRLIVRKMFPEKVKVRSVGRALGSAAQFKNVFHLSTNIYLNEGLALPFEKLISKKPTNNHHLTNKKGEANKLPPNVHILKLNVPFASIPNFIPEGREFGMLENGVTNGA